MRKGNEVSRDEPEFGESLEFRARSRMAKVGRELGQATHCFTVGQFVVISHQFSVRGRTHCSMLGSLPLTENGKLSQCDRFFQSRVGFSPRDSTHIRIDDRLGSCTNSPFSSRRDLLTLRPRHSRPCLGVAVFTSREAIRHGSTTLEVVGNSRLRADGCSSNPSCRA